jgi:hypothetical protein
LNINKDKAHAHLRSRPLAPAAFALAALLSGRAFAQAAPTPSTEPPEEITVRGQKSLAEYRVELERQRDEIFRMFNAANEGNDTDIRCKNEQPTGSRMRQSVCRSNAENRHDAAAARGFLTALLQNAGLYITNSMIVPNGGDTQLNANVGSRVAQGDAEAGEQDALAKFELEWKRLLTENQELYQAVVKYVELDTQYSKARGVAVPVDLEQALQVQAQAPARPTGPQCEATTLTEYFQRNNVARVTGTVSIANCTAGTAGNFTLVARVRDESGEIKPVEFSEAAGGRARPRLQWRLSDRRQRRARERARARLDVHVRRRSASSAIAASPIEKT